MSYPELYVIAGPNGSGKSVSAPFIIPKNISIIDTDDLASQLSKKAGGVNATELANREAVWLLNNALENKTSIAFETNLCDNETWQFILAWKNRGYIIHLFFICVDSIELLNMRIKARADGGGHFIHPRIVEDRYHAALKLMQIYKHIPNYLFLVDHSYMFESICEFHAGKEIRRAKNLPFWCRYILNETGE